jgi:hypothetical protein
VRTRKECERAVLTNWSAEEGTNGNTEECEQEKALTFWRARTETRVRTQKGRKREALTFWRVQGKGRSGYGKNASEQWALTNWSADRGTSQDTERM